MTRAGSSGAAAPDIDGTGLRIGIISARFNDHIVVPLRDGARRALARTGVADSDITEAWVPGAFELPLAAKVLASTGSVDAVICLGTVIRGDTPHFDVVVAEVSKGVAAVSRDTGVPVIFGVLTTDTMQQALERAGIKSNLGWSYGLQAIEMGSLMAALPG